MGVVQLKKKEREFNLTDKDFNLISKIVGERTGIVLSSGKRDMVYSRLTRRLRALGLTHFRDYCDLIQSGDEAELLEFTNAITTNLTSFFREPHHFDYLAKNVLPNLVKNKLNRRLRVWSAGCSSGEEPYTLAITLKENIPVTWDVKILATDLDTNMVAKGKSGIYESEKLTGLSKSQLKKWVRRGRGEQDGLVCMADSLKEMITFKQLNLMHDWPVKGPFDIIFCRNVVIYFDKDTQRILFDRYANMLDSHGHLFIGHSESLHNVSNRFKLLGKTIYQKTG
jgi:chemotaxis protein methyltransferase CheR